MPTVKYIWDGDNIAMEKDEHGVTLAVYTDAPGQFGNLISQRRGGQTSYYHYDGLGSTRELTDATETVTDTNMYDAWGVNRESTGTTEYPFRWVGEKGYYTDKETGSVAVRRRVYEPEDGRWRSRDPLGFVDGVNEFAYVLNGPTFVIDPSGMACQTGIRNVPGRGIFADVILRGRNGRVEPNKVGSLFGAIWKPRAADFKDGDCCCCDEIGFVQTVNTSIAYQYSRTGGMVVTSSGWKIDKRIPYKYKLSPTTFPSRRLSTAVGRTGAPCTGAQIGMEDAPGHKVRIVERVGSLIPGFPGNTYSYQLFQLKQDFETCVVCLKGREGIQVGGVIDRSLTQMITYGCVTWGHEWRRNTKFAGSYIVRRHLNGTVRPRPETATTSYWANRREDSTRPTWWRAGFGNPERGENPNPVDGKPPSGRFVSLLKSWYYVSGIGGWRP